MILTLAILSLASLALAGFALDAAESADYQAFIEYRITKKV